MMNCPHDIDGGDYGECLRCGAMFFKTSGGLWQSYDDGRRYLVDEHPERSLHGEPEQTPREKIAKLAAMSPEEFNRFMLWNFQRICRKGDPRRLEQEDEFMRELKESERTDRS